MSATVNPASPSHSPTASSSASPTHVPPLGKISLLHEPLPKARLKATTWRTRAWKTLVLAGVLAALLWTVKWWFFPETGNSGEIVAILTRGDLPIIVTERGELSRSKAEDIRCNAQG